MSKQDITVIGAGITGLWQALILAKEGYNVTLIEKSDPPFANCASQYAGAMLAPYCEQEPGTEPVKEFGQKSIEAWQKHYPGIEVKGTLVVADPRDRGELKHFAKKTTDYRWLSREDLAELEPEFSASHHEALYYSEEAHMHPLKAMDHLLQTLQQANVRCLFGKEAPKKTESDWVIDCSGLNAANTIKGLRGVRGERLIIKCEELALNRPIRLLHPRFPLYIVPWSENRFMVGATEIETASKRAVTIRSALELLSAAYALNKTLAEAEIIDIGVGIRPAFADNLPKIIIDGQTIYVNGLYRHGFLLAPILAEHVANYIRTGDKHSSVFIEEKLS